MKDGKLSGAPSSQNRHCQSRAMAAIPTVKGSALERGRVVGGAKMDDWGGGVLLILTGSLLLIQKKSEINSHSGEAR